MIAAICALAKNTHDRSEIKRDFKASFREMKRRARMLASEDPEEDDDSDDDDGDIASTADKLQVFCCSSTEYQKLRKKSNTDGPPKVFSNLKETQIPDMQKYVHEMTNIRQRQSLEGLIHNLGRLVFDMHIYFSEEFCPSGVKPAGIAIETELKSLDTNLDPVLQKLSADINDIFDHIVRPKIEEGASSASAKARNTCAKWGAPSIRDRTRNRSEGGLSCPTYKATTRRNGEFTSPTFGQFDFNEDLAAPMYRNMPIVWNTVFSGRLSQVMEGLKIDIKDLIEDFTGKLPSQLEFLGIDVIRTDSLATQAIRSAKNKIGWHLFVSQSLFMIRIRRCAADSGKGVFDRMKAYMAQGIDNERGSMFDEAKQMLMEQLNKLRNVDIKAHGAG
ncbi:hypothetical protein MAR_027239 [Mya arenaria]|uniref:Uncharacterized protein n=1 Tax=Mya arenaria TaxID=6604 RepID=A0ABY7EVS8_MYAAR|nr:hypothetical protein MAR_027239 [Mya arenaria]